MSPAVFMGYSTQCAAADSAGSLCWMYLNPKQTYRTGKQAETLDPNTDEWTMNNKKTQTYIHNSEGSMFGDTGAAFFYAT